MSVGIGNTFPLASYVPTQSLPASRTETTIFDQVYGNYRRRPAMISLNVQWVPVGDRSGAYQWSGGDSANSSRKMKTVTYFGTGEMRGQQRTKVVTPPSSDYTDAYLSTFAAKPIPTRHIHRLSTSVFANSAPIPLKPTSTPIFTSSSMKMNQTGFETMSSSSSMQASNTSDRPTFPSSSSFVPERPATYQPFSSTQYSSPQSQTFTTSYSTLLRSPTSTYTSSSSPSVDTQRSYTTLPTRSQPYTSPLPPFNRSETSYDSIYKPLAPYSVQSYPPSNVDTTLSPSTSVPPPYSSYKPFESTSSNIIQSETTDRIILPTPRVEKPMGRPETLLFQHDEDLRSSRITKPSPMFNPSPETPTLREEPQLEPEPTRLDDLITASSAPIRILESTLNKYDSLINQISEVLASVSPLSSTISSMSPGKSVLDYQLSSDDSPMVPYKRIESQLSQQSAPIKSNDSSQTKSSHLIREDSYDKIATALSDLDTVMISPSDAQKSPPSMNKEAKTSFVDDNTHYQWQSKQEEEMELASSFNEPQTSTTMEKDTNETTSVSIETQPSPSTTQGDEQIKEAAQTATTSEETVKETKPSPTHEQATASSTQEENKETETSLLEGEQTEDEMKTDSANEQAVPSTSEEARPSSSDDQQSRPGDEEHSTTTEKKDAQQVSTEEKIEEAKTISADDQQIASIDQVEPAASLEETQELSTSSETQEKQQTSSVSQGQTEELLTTAGEEQQVSESAEKEHLDVKAESTDELQVRSTSTGENVEETKSPAVDQPQRESIPAEMEKQEVHTEKGPEHPVVSAVEPETSSTAEEEIQNAAIPSATSSVLSPSDVSTPEVSSTNEEKLPDEPSTADESIQQQTGLSSSVPEEMPEMSQREGSPLDDASSKKGAKHVTWDETVIDNEDDVDSLSQSLTDESNNSESSAITTTDDHSITADELKAAIDQSVNSSDAIESQRSVAVDSPASQDVSIEQQSFSSDLRETPSELSGQPLLSPNPADAQSFTTTDKVAQSSTSEPNEVATKDEQKAEPPSQSVDNAPDKSDEATVQEVTSVPQSTIISPIDTLPASVANRYISSDVYHGYLGDHQGYLLDNASDVDNDSSTKSLLTSLRETIAAPMTPLIETIQSVVSSMQTTTVAHPLKTENEITGHAQAEAPLSASAVDHAKEEVSESVVQAEENKSTPDTSEQAKTIFESLRDAVTAPLSAVAETIQTVVSNLQSDKHDTTSTSTSEQSTVALTEKSPTVDEELPLKTTSSSDEQIDDQPKTLSTTTDIRPDNEPSVSAGVMHEESVVHSVGSDTTISTSTDTAGTPVEGVGEQEERQKSKPVELSSPRVSESVPAADKTEGFITDHYEQVDTTEYPSTDTSLISSSPEDQTIGSSASSPDIERAQKVFPSIPTSSEPTDTDNKQNTLSSESSESTAMVQSTAESPSSEDEDREKLSSSTTAGHAVADQQEIRQAEPTTIEKMNEVTVEQTIDEQTSAETKTTLDTIRDVIAHPFAALSEKIQSILPTSTSESSEEIAADATSKSMIDTPKEAVTTVTSEEKPEPTEAKTTLETIREVMTHPIATITEKIHSVLSSSDNEHADRISSAAEHVQSTDQESLLTAASVTTTEDQPESKSTLDTLRDVLTHPLATLTEKIQSVMSSSTVDEATTSEQHIATSAIDQSKERIVATEATDSTSATDQDTVTHPSGLVDEGTGQNIVTNVSNQISPSEDQISASEGSRVYFQDPIHDAQVMKTTTQSSSDSISYESDEVISSANQLLVETIRDLIHETISSVIKNLDQDTMKVAALANNSSISEATWSDLVDPDQDLIRSSDDTLDEQTRDETATALSDQSQSVPLMEDGTEQNVIAFQRDDMMQQPSNALQLDSIPATTETERISLSDLREPSPTNTEDDPSELIHALQGHSILVASSSPLRTQAAANQSSLSTSAAEKSDEQVLPTAEKSSSSATTSSQITSSDRYVSYAIHEMGDSSQERLPSFPVAADIPVYQSEKKTSDESKEQHALSEPIGNNNQGAGKDEDLTELDATENLTSYSDDFHIQKQTNLRSNQQQQLDASSTDEDVDDENFNELEASDISNLYRIVDEITRPSAYEQTYQRYDLSTSSSVSTKPQTDDIYIIPGYPGLWKPSADDDDSSHSGFANDADDEDEKNQSTTAMKTKATTRTTNSAKFQPLSPQQNTTYSDVSSDIFNRPLNEFSFDVSESDSFKTCASTINSSSTSKQAKAADLHQVPISEQHEHQVSPDEKIILIRERERGVSLPVTMKIDYDDMALRLSSSTPIDTSLYSSVQTGPPSPSTSHEPIQKTTSSSGTSTPSLSSNESDQQKPPSASPSSWLNTINTITTTTEGPDGPLEARTTIHKSARGPISVAECEPQGKYIVLENTSRSKSVALAGWTLQQENDNGDVLTFTFPDNCLLRSNQSLKILSRSNETERRNSDLIASLLSSWHTGSNVVTKLINAEGKDRASLTKKTLFS